VRIESVEHRHDDVTGSHDDDGGEVAGEDDIATRADDDSEPLLLVFSNDRHHRRFDSRELHELIEREMDLYKTGDLPAAAIPPGAGDTDYGDDEYADADDYDAQYFDFDEELDDDRERVVSRAERDTAAVSDGRAPAARRDVAEQTRSRVRRARFRRRMRRNICRRRPMYVNFEDIHWNGWIIEPQGYQVRNGSTAAQHSFTRH